MNPINEEVVAIGLISRIEGSRCMHHGMAIDKDCYQVQLIRIMEVKSQVSLQVPNLNDDPSQLELKDAMGINLLCGKVNSYKRPWPVEYLNASCLGGDIYFKSL
jgi:hypothetical protein